MQIETKRNEMKENKNYRNGDTKSTKTKETYQRRPNETKSTEIAKNEPKSKRKQTDIDKRK